MKTLVMETEEFPHGPGHHMAREATAPIVTDRPVLKLIHELLTASCRPGPNHLSKAPPSLTFYWVITRVKFQQVLLWDCPTYIPMTIVQIFINILSICWAIFMNCFLKLGKNRRALSMVILRLSWQLSRVKWMETVWKHSWSCEPAILLYVWSRHQGPLKASESSYLLGRVCHGDGRSFVKEVLRDEGPMTKGHIA